MDLFLGLPYCTGDQQRFQRALEIEDVEEAMDILEKLPHASKYRPEEELYRNSFLAIGYREIVRKIVPLVPGEVDIGAMLAEHKQYRKVGTPDEVEKMVEEHKKYRELGEVDELRSVVDAEERLSELASSLKKVPSI